MNMPSLSSYVPMRDGVALAVDVHLPKHRMGPVPAVIQFTRYWRGVEWASPPLLDPDGYREHEAFADRGFAYVSVDCRGSGASFGSRPTEYGPAEVADFPEMVAWTEGQDWCDGSVATTGLSYAGNCAELAGLGAAESLTAIAPRFADFDWYEHILFPGGARNIAFAPEWAALVNALDRGDPAPLNSSKPPDLPAILGVARTSADTTGTLRAQALAQHAANADFWETISSCEFRDDPESLPRGRAPANLAELLPGRRSNVPAMVWAGWLDAGTAAGALARFHSVSGPSQLVIGPWNHGALLDCDPLSGTVPQEVSRTAQIEIIARFFRRARQGKARSRRVHYFVMGERKWRSARCWPPQGVKMIPLYLAQSGRLEDRVPLGGGTSYRVDPASGTGPRNRWTTSLGGGPVDYGDRSEADRNLLVYEGDPLPEDLVLSGDPKMSLWIRSSAEDGLFIAYLEARAPSGRVTYLSEGVLRAVHRRLPRSFERADALPLEIGATTLLEFPILPLAARIPRGWRLRLAIAGADVDSFAPLGGEATAPLIDVLHGGDTASALTLPIVERN